MSKTSKIKSTIIEEAEIALKGLKFSKISIKLKAIAALKNNSMLKVAEVFEINRNTLRNWVNSFAEGGVKALEAIRQTGQPSKLNNQQKEWVIEQVKDYTKNWTIARLCLAVFDKFAIKISESTMRRVLKNSGFSYITPRPKHYKQVAEKGEEFKKKSPRKNKKQS
jgi:transposase